MALLKARGRSVHFVTELSGNLTPILSKRAEVFESIHWDGRRGWWLKDRTLPNIDFLGDADSVAEEETAGRPESQPAAISSTPNQGGQHAAPLA